jgi:hypothetical protein
VACFFSTTQECLGTAPPFRWTESHCVSFCFLFSFPVPIHSDFSSMTLDLIRERYSTDIQEVKGTSAVCLMWDPLSFPLRKGLISSVSIPGEADCLSSSRSILRSLEDPGPTSLKLLQRRKISKSKCYVLSHTMGNPACIPG